MEINKEPFKISIEHYGEKIILEVPYSDVDLNKAVSMCGKLLLAAGYDREQIENALNIEIV